MVALPHDAEGREVIPALVIALVAFFGLVALASFVVHVLRVESAAWRALAATVLTSPVMVDHVHRLHDETVRDARKLVKLTTTGREEAPPSRRVVGSPIPEARAARVIQEESVAAMGLRIQSLYREQGEMRDLTDCIREAQQVLAGELTG